MDMCKRIPLISVTVYLFRILTFISDNNDGDSSRMETTYSDLHRLRGRLYKFLSHSSRY